MIKLFEFETDVSRDSARRFTKRSRETITLLEGLGVAGDAHVGKTVQHRSRVAADPAQPNLRQVHLIHSELFAEAAAAGFTLQPGDLGEHETTAGIYLLALPRGTRLQIGHDDKGRVVRKAGVVGIKVRSGVVRLGDKVAVILPQEPHYALSWFGSSWAVDVYKGNLIWKSCGATRIDHPAGPTQHGAVTAEMPCLGSAFPRRAPLFLDWLLLGGGGR